MFLLKHLRVDGYLVNHCPTADQSHQRILDLGVIDNRTGPHHPPVGHSFHHLLVNPIPSESTRVEVINEIPSFEGVVIFGEGTPTQFDGKIQGIP